MKRIFLIVLATISTIVTYACKCRIMAFSEEVAEADQIFVGTVINKTSADKAYYLFTVSKTFKGGNSDTLTIQTGLGGPDCGMLFEVGKTYVVFSYNKQTTSCRRNALSTGNSDLVKLSYLFEPSFSSAIGKGNDPVLTNNEAVYFNAELLKQRKDFDFQGKKVAFVLSGSFIDKQKYFEDSGGNDVVTDLIILTEEEKLRANGYSAIIVSWRKQGISKSFRKKLIRRLI